MWRGAGLSRPSPREDATRTCSPARETLGNVGALRKLLLGQPRVRRSFLTTAPTCTPHPPLGTPERPCTLHPNTTILSTPQEWLRQ